MRAVDRQVVDVEPHVRKDLKDAVCVDDGRRTVRPRDAEVVLDVEIANDVVVLVQWRRGIDQRRPRQRIRSRRQPDDVGAAVLVRAVTLAVLDSVVYAMKH